MRLQIRYRSGDGVTTERVISDIVVEPPKMLDAFCEMRGERRSFAVDRIDSAADADTGEVINDIGLHFGLAPTTVPLGPGSNIPSEQHKVGRQRFSSMELCWASQRPPLAVALNGFFNHAPKKLMMIVRKIAFATLLALSTSAFAADAVTALPKKMEGQWGSTGKKVEIELIKMESPTKAKLEVIFWDGCTRQGEATAELKEGAWSFVAPGGVRCEDIKVKMTQVAGKNRFEGDYETVWRGPATGKLYLEW